MPDRDIHYRPSHGGGPASQWRRCRRLAEEWAHVSEINERFPLKYNAPKAVYDESYRANRVALRGSRPKTTTDVTRVTCAECRAQIREAVTW